MMRRRVENTFADEYEGGKLFQEVHKTDFPESLDEGQL